MPGKRRKPGAVAAGASLAAEVWLKLDRAVRRHGGKSEDIERLGTDDGVPLIDAIGKMVAGAGKNVEESASMTAVPASIIRVVNATIRTLTITVNHDERVTGYVGCVWTTAKRREDRVPVCHGTEEFEVELRCFGRKMSSDGMIAAFGREDLQPLAPEEHVVLFKATKNDPGLPVPIASLGASWRAPDGQRLVPSLKGDVGRRCLVLLGVLLGSWRVWDDAWWFAGRRKVPKP